MAEYNAYLGGAGLKWPMDSTRSTGAPGANLRYSGHIPRSMFTLPFWFDGGREEWREFMRFNTTQGKGFAVGDSIVMTYAPGASLFGGGVFHLKKDLPTGIGLTITIESIAAEVNPEATDNFTTKTVTIPAGAKNGFVFIDGPVDKTSFSPFGAKATVTFTSASGVAAGQALNVNGVCFEFRYNVTSFNDTEECSCNDDPCYGEIPGPACMPEYTVGTSPYRAPADAISDAPSGTTSTSTGTGTGSTGTGTGTTGTSTTGTGRTGSSTTGTGSTGTTGTN